MRVATASFRTVCPSCDHQIQPTNRIVTERGVKARHYSCVPLSDWVDDARKYFAGVAADLMAEYSGTHS